MSLRLSNLRLPADLPEEAYPERFSKLLDLPRETLLGYRILRKSLDLRDKRQLTFVVSAAIDLPQEETRRWIAHPRRLAGATIEAFEEESFTLPPRGERPLSERPVVVGSGPAGLLAAYVLAEQGYKPLVLERGPIVHERIEDVRQLESRGPLDPESNYLFGEGGAGTFSDGKLTCRGSGPDVRRVLEIFAACKGKPSILYDHRPHLGSNRLPAVVKALRRGIEAWGGEFRFRCRVEDIILVDGALRGLVTSSGTIATSTALLAIGHSARDTIEMLLRRGVPMVAKPFQFGVRIEQPQEQVNRVQYGTRRWEQILGAADYTLIAHGPLDLFTFCMCAGGQVIPSVSEPEFFSTNGMSLSKRASPFANSGLMVTLGPEHFGNGDVLAGMRWQRMFEGRAFALSGLDYLCPIQRAHDFLLRRPTRDRPESSYQRGVIGTQLADLLPTPVVAALEAGLPLLDRRWHGEFLRNATLVGPEARGSSPVRILRDSMTLETPGIRGLFPVGEGAGYAGGIVSAAVDGLRVAKALMAQYAPLEQR